MITWQPGLLKKKHSPLEAPVTTAIFPSRERGTSLAEDDAVIFAQQSNRKELKKVQWHRSVGCTFLDRNFQEQRTDYIFFHAKGK